MGLIEGVVGRAHEGAGLNVFEAHGFAENFEFGEFVGVDVAEDREMFTGGL
jgi:hypothetical protein